MRPDLALIPVTRDRIAREYVDGDLAVKVAIATTDREAFLTLFPDVDLAGYMATEKGAIEVTRGQIVNEARDGALTITVKIEPAKKVDFYRLWPRPGLAAFLARENPLTGRQAMLDAERDEPPRYGAEARLLRRHINWMMNPKIWRAVGSDEDYRNWLRTVPCASCKWTPHDLENAFVPCEPAHVRRIEHGAGTALKPDYSAIPLCPSRLVGDRRIEGCHEKQHRVGESGLAVNFDKARIKYVTQWVWETLKAELGYAHWNEVPPGELLAWAEARGLEEYLPAAYREG